MKLGVFQTDDRRCVGMVVGENAFVDVSPIVGRGSDVGACIADPSLIEQLNSVADGRSGFDIRTFEKAQFCPPILRPGKILCLAGNYRKHIAESGFIEPKTQANFTQQLFIKPSTTLTANRSVIELGPANAKVGWEAELAVIIGRSGRNIPVEYAHEHIFGYSILNDLSERGLNSRLQDRHLREMDGFLDWLGGKWFDGFAPFGPWIVTRDEIADPHDLRIRFFLNGELRQDGNTSEMIFGIAEQIAYASSIMTLEPGDVISTGTPAGAGLGDARTSLADGDEMLCEIEGIGKLQNTVRWNA